MGFYSSCSGACIVFQTNLVRMARARIWPWEMQKPFLFSFLYSWQQCLLLNSSSFSVVSSGALPHTHTHDMSDQRCSDLVYSLSQVSFCMTTQYNLCKI